MKRLNLFLRSVGLGVLMLLLVGCSTVVQVPSASANEPSLPLPVAELAFERVLQRHVNTQGEVDFVGLRDDRSSSGLPALRQYLRAIASTPLSVDSAVWANPNVRLAHMINAYNALSMYNVIASGIPDSHAGLARVQFFILREFDIGGELMSLYAFENDIIRKIDEPRVHFALNCSAVSCPVLPRTLFTGGGLEAELQQETLAFFGRAENLTIDHTTRTVVLSEILDFYPDDFVPSHAPSLLAYAQRYSAKVIPQNYKVVFRPYDWTVANSQRQP